MLFAGAVAVKRDLLFRSSLLLVLWLDKARVDSICRILVSTCSIKDFPLNSIGAREDLPLKPILICMPCLSSWF